jgi:protein-L-isoaspartate(D-aspartate) O-methyltransferase
VKILVLLLALTSLAAQGGPWTKALQAQGVTDPRVLAAFDKVQRADYLPDAVKARELEDLPLPIGEGQPTSQPSLIALMIQQLQLPKDCVVLEIGTGSGYQTAVLALLARWVFSLERVGELARAAIQRMRELELDTVKIQTFDGTVGWSEMAPYDRILVTAGAPAVPPPLLDQLAPGGRLVVPEGPRASQMLALYVKDRFGELQRQETDAVAFVPLVGRHGWQPED